MEKNMKNDINFLRSLEAAGVDNWDGYNEYSDYMEVININVEELSKEEEEKNRLEFLIAAGVDNWDGYEYAVDLYLKEYADLEIIEQNKREEEKENKKLEEERIQKEEEEKQKELERKTQERKEYIKYVFENSKSEKTLEEFEQDFLNQWDSINWNEKKLIDKANKEVNIKKLICNVLNIKKEYLLLYYAEHMEL